MAELKPCPFCGGKASVKQVRGDTQRFYVDCDLSKGSCACIPSTWQYDTAEEAVEGWNRRANDG